MEVGKTSSTVNLDQMKVADLYAEDELFNFDSSSDEEEEAQDKKEEVTPNEDKEEEEIIETLTRVSYSIIRCNMLLLCPNVCKFDHPVMKVELYNL